MNTYHTKHAPHAGPPLFSVDLAVLAAARAGGDRGDGVRAAPHAALCIRQARHADEIFLPASVRGARRQLRQYSARDLGGRTRRDGPYRELLRHRLRRPQYHRPVWFCFCFFCWWCAFFFVGFVFFFVFFPHLFFFSVCCC